MPSKEITVISDMAMPKGYGFLPKGDRYKTMHCRKLTHDACKTLYVVVDSKKRQLGLRAPKAIVGEVYRQAKETLPARRAAVRKRDLSLIETAATELDKQFPDLPEKEKAVVLKHGFRKHSGRVGRTSTLSMPRKILLAVIAHVRHRHTQYDDLLTRGVDRTDARKAANRKIGSIMRGWGYIEDLSWYFKDNSYASDVGDDPEH